MIGYLLPHILELGPKRFYQLRGFHSDPQPYVPDKLAQSGDQGRTVRQRLRLLGPRLERLTASAWFETVP